MESGGMSLCGLESWWTLLLPVGQAPPLPGGVEPPLSGAEFYASDCEIPELS